MFDLIITGGTCVLPSGAQRADIAVRGEKIAAIGSQDTFDSDGAQKVVDASDQIVIPGGVDPHIHCSTRIPVPGGEPIVTGPPATVSRAALYGGTTTLIDFVVCWHDRSIEQSIAETEKNWKGESYCDYAFHILLQGNIPLAQYGQLVEAMQAGHASIKIFTTNVRPDIDFRMVKYGDICELLKLVSAQGGVACIHAEDNDIVMYMYEKLTRENRVGFEHMAEVHNSLSEDLSFNRVIRLAENIPGAALYMMHTSAASGVAAIAASRSKGFPIYGETLHQYLLFNVDDYRKPNGQMYHNYPSLKFPDDQRALWSETNGGAIQTIATDELCCPLRVKLRGSRIDDTTGGNAGVEPRLSLMYTQMVGKRGYSLEQFVGLVSSNAAKILGLYPRKGALAPGSDADIVILDPRQRKTLRAAELHETDYSPWEGHVVTAWPSVTIAHGKVVVENNQFFGDLNDGKCLPRKIADAIRSRPAV
jgi:dihydropyrimidinase